MTSLTILPTEIVLHIAQYLSLDSFLCLLETSNALLSRVGLPEKATVYQMIMCSKKMLLWRVMKKVVEEKNPDLDALRVVLKVALEHDQIQLIQMPRMIYLQFDDLHSLRKITHLVQLNILQDMFKGMMSFSLLRSALKFATEFGHLDKVQFLIDQVELHKYDKSICNDILATAAENGNLIIFEKLLAVVGNDIPKSYLDNALIEAALKGHDVIIERLLQFPRIKVSAKNYEALACAVSGNHKAVYERLLTAVDPADTVTAFRVVLKHAADQGNLELIHQSLLHVTESDISQSFAIAYAAAGGHSAVLELLLSKTSAEAASAYDNCAVRWALSNGHWDLAERYLFPLPQVNPLACHQDALLWAVRNGHLLVVERLLERGADATACNNAPLRWACEQGHLAIVDRLLTCENVDVSVNNNECYVSALENGHQEVFTRLWSHSQKGNFGPLFVAAVKVGNVSLAKELLTKAPHSVHEQCFMIATENGNVELMNLIFTAGRIQYTQRSDALAVAITKGQLPAVKMLQSKYGVKDEDLIRARKLGHLDVYEYLLNLKK